MRKISVKKIRVRKIRKTAAVFSLTLIFCMLFSGFFGITVVRAEGTGKKDTVYFTGRPMTQTVLTERIGTDVDLDVYDSAIEQSPQIRVGIQITSGNEGVFEDLDGDNYYTVLTDYDGSVSFRVTEIHIPDNNEVYHIPSFHGRWRDGRLSFFNVRVQYRYTGTLPREIDAFDGWSDDGWITVEEGGEYTINNITADSYGDPERLRSYIWERLKYDRLQIRVKCDYTFDNDDYLFEDQALSLEPDILFATIEPSKNVVVESEAEPNPGDGTGIIGGQDETDVIPGGTGEEGEGNNPGDNGKPQDNGNPTDNGNPQDNGNKGDGKQDGGIIDPGIVEGWKPIKDTLSVLGGVAAGLLGAIGLSGLTGGIDSGKIEETVDEYLKKKTYRLVVYKEFGNTIKRGEEVVVYACIMEKDEKGIEKENPELTKKINILSEDGIFMIEEQENLAGVYKAARVRTDPVNSKGKTEGIISFKFTGKGGTYTNRMKFLLEGASIEFAQENIAFRACDRGELTLGFNLHGMDPEKAEVKVEMSTGSSYETELYPSENIPGSYFILFKDVNSEKGDPGTYSKQKVFVTATEGEETIMDSIPVFRVTEGLDFGVQRIACYHALKKESVNKDPMKLDISDYDTVYTVVKAMVLMFDEKEHKVWHEPADVRFSFDVPDFEEGDRSEAATASYSEESVKKKVNEMGLTYKLAGISDSMAEYRFFCTKGYLLSPLRILVGLCGITSKTMPDGTVRTYETKKNVILESQPFRDNITARTDEDMKIQSYIDELENFIYSSASRRGDSVEEGGFGNSALGMDDNAHYSVFDKLSPFLVYLEEMDDGYDPHYGFDKLKLYQIKAQMDEIIKLHQMYFLKDRQRLYEKMKDTAHHDMNSFIGILQRDFALISEKYVDTWGGLAVRIAAGVIYGVAGDMAFMTLDMNKAIVNYEEKTLLYDRDGKGYLIAGSTPLATYVISGGIIKGTISSAPTVINAIVPKALRESAAEWTNATARKIVSKIPQNYIEGVKNLYNGAKLKLQTLNSLSYDPKSKCLVLYDAAAAMDDAALRAKNEAIKILEKIKKGPKSNMSKLKSMAHEAAELDAAGTLKKYKEAVDHYNMYPDEAHLKELKDAYFDMQQNSFAINKLNLDAKTGAMIEKNIRTPNRYIEMFNKNQKEFLNDKAEPLIKKELLEIAKTKGNYTEKDIKFFKATGNKGKSGTGSRHTGMDIDTSPYIEGPNGEKIYFTQKETNMACAKAYSEVSGKSFSTYEEAMENMRQLKIRAVTPEDPEFYQSFSKVMNAEDINDMALSMNMQEGMYKMTYEYRKAQKVFDEVVSDASRYNKAMKEMESFMNRNKSFSQLSSDAKTLMYESQTQFECLHQCAKIQKIYDKYDLIGQKLGHKSAISSESRVFTAITDSVEKQGVNHINLGEMNEALETLGGYENCAQNLMNDCKNATINARGINGEVIKEAGKGMERAMISGAEGIFKKDK